MSETLTAVAVRVATEFGPEYQVAARTFEKTRDPSSLREILAISADVLGVVTGIYFVIGYLMKNRSAKNTDIALDISQLPIDERKKAERIIKAVRSELGL